MPRLTHAKLREFLTRALRLRTPEFRLKNYGSQINGHIISETFKGKGDHQRQKMIWDALEGEWGHDIATKSVGMLLAYTPMEWNLDAEEPVEETPTRARLVGK